MEENNLTQLEKIIRESDLSQKEQEEFISLFFPANDFELSDVVYIFSRQPDFIRKTYDTCQKKKRAIDKNNPALWREILEKEYEELDGLEDSSK